MRPRLRLRHLCLFAALLVPSGIFAYLYRDMPKFESYHDGSIYFVGARSLAETHGYRIESLPGEPAQTKYPPLFSAILAAAWRINPAFPANLPLATAIAWSTIPLLILACLLCYRQWGFSERVSWILTALIAVNPLTALFGANLFSETLYTPLLVVFALACERARGDRWWRWALAAAVAGSLAYLTRTAAIVVIPAAIVFFAINRQLRRGAVICALMLPAVLGWTIWVRSSMRLAQDPAWMYYTNYVGYQFLNVRLADLPLVVWRNLDELLWGMGALVIPKFSDSLLVKIAAQVVAVAMIAGCVRLFREQPRVRMFGLIASASVGVLLVWHFPPNERFVYPLFPLLVAGLWREARQFIHSIRATLETARRAERISAWALSAAAGCLAAGCLLLQAAVLVRHLPNEMEQNRRERSARLAAYNWIGSHTGTSARVLAFDDPSFFLATGRHAMSMPMPPRYWYYRDGGAVRAFVHALPEFAARHGLAFVFLTHRDTEPNVQDTAATPELRRVLRNDSGLRLVFDSPAASIYAVQMASAGGLR